MAEERGVMTQETSTDLMSVEQARAIQEVQASMVIAKKFPRDQEAAFIRIMKACERYSLAEQAEYAYPRGNGTVTGPSIRLAEALAQNWGNMQFGIRELSQTNGESEIETFAWDLETNTREIKAFKVPHKRYSRSKGLSLLRDPRDVYEHIANQGARRMRACILGIIPGDIVEAAMKKCRETLKKGINTKPLIDQIRITLNSFDSIGVTKKMIEQRLGHGVDTITADELIELKNIGRSIRDNITKREDWFDFVGQAEKKAKKMTEDIKTGSNKSSVKYKAEDLPPAGEDDPQAEYKTEPPPQEVPSFRDEYVNLRSKGFKKWVNDNLKRIYDNASEEDQQEIREKWYRMYPNETYPLDPDPINPEDEPGYIPPAPVTDEDDPTTVGNGNAIVHCPVKGSRVSTQVCAEKCDKAETCQVYQEWKFEQEE